MVWKYLGPYAIFDMSREGWIYRIQSRGTFVKGIPETYIPRSKSVTVQSPTAEIGCQTNVGSSISTRIREHKRLIYGFAAVVSFFCLYFSAQNIKIIDIYDIFIICYIFISDKGV